MAPQHPIYLLWFWTKPEEFGFTSFKSRLETSGFISLLWVLLSITITSFNSGLKLDPRLKPNLNQDWINWVQEGCWKLNSGFFSL